MGLISNLGNMDGSDISSNLLQSFFLVFGNEKFKMPINVVKISIYCFTFEIHFKNVVTSDPGTSKSAEIELKNSRQCYHCTEVAIILTNNKP